jgi:hypothetical protein
MFNHTIFQHFDVFPFSFTVKYVPFIPSYIALFCSLYAFIGETFQWLDGVCFCLIQFLFACFIVN